MLGTADFARHRVRAAPLLPRPSPPDTPGCPPAAERRHRLAHGEPAVGTPRRPQFLSAPAEAASAAAPLRVTNFARADAAPPGLVRARSHAEPHGSLAMGHTISPALRAPEQVAPICFPVSAVLTSFPVAFASMKCRDSTRPHRRAQAKAADMGKHVRATNSSFGAKSALLAFLGYQRVLGRSKHLKFALLKEKRLLEPFPTRAASTAGGYQ